jgi:hypothetical protein
MMSYHRDADSSLTRSKTSAGLAGSRRNLGYLTARRCGTQLKLATPALPQLTKLLQNAEEASSFGREPDQADQQLMRDVGVNLTGTRTLLFRSGAQFEQML